jgi:hypothetical protein
MGLTVEAAFPLRHRDRALWFKVGNDLRRHDPARLVREAIKDGDIVQGLRNADEVIASRAEGLVDLFLWIHRDVAIDPTMTFGPDLCDLIIENNQSLEDFYRKLRAFSAFARILI